MSRSKLTKKARKRLEQSIQAYTKRGTKGAHWEHYQDVKKTLEEVDRLTRENIRLSGGYIKPKLPFKPNTPTKAERDAGYVQLRKSMSKGSYEGVKKRW